jgi:hypothetical protein
MTVIEEENLAIHEAKVLQGQRNLICKLSIGVLEQVK